MRWLAGFIFDKIAFGLLSVLLPLYITQTVSGGSLTAWGIIAASATVLAIPFSFLWGYLCDKTQRYKFFILLSFAAIAALLYIFSLVTDLFLVGAIYTSIIVFQVAHEPPKNVLIAETYSHMEWKHAFALYEAWTELGWIIGLLLGSTLIFFGLSISTLLLAPVWLSLLSFLTSVAFITDPPLIFERGLVAIEKSVSLVQRGAVLLSRGTTNPHFLGELKQENASALCIGLVFFSLATSMFFTPLPIFFSKNLALQTSVIFMLFLLNSTSCLSGYLLVKGKTDGLEESKTIKRVALLRCPLVLLPVVVPFTSSFGAMTLSVTVLAGMGFLYAFYSVSVISASMEVIPQGKAGLFTALVGAGSAIGCLTGSVIAENISFQGTFIASAVCFLLSFFAFEEFV
jgi:MFS family permease